MKLGDIAIKSIEEYSHVYIKLARDVWETPETAFGEFHASHWCSCLLEESGFNVTRSYGGIPTAIRAVYGSGAPVIGLLAEYDALPGQSQRDVPHQEPVLEGGCGHGCGHNLLCAAMAAAAIGIKEELAVSKRSGTVVFYGCPAEEVLVGKGIMASKGAFRELDAALAWHPGRYNRVAANISTGVNGTKFHFRGITSHAAVEPEMGRSALDAVELMDSGVNYLREHVPSDVRIHYVITDGGTAPNIVPDHAAVWYYDRALTRETMAQTEKRILKVALGAAMMTETELSVENMGGCYPTLSNQVLVRLLDSCMRQVEQEPWTAQEIEYARKINSTIPEIWKSCVKFSGSPDPDTQIFSGVMEPDYDNDYGSTDVGDVGHMVPTVFYKTSCYNIAAPGHSWQVAACVGTSIGMKGMLYGAKITALAALRLMADPKLVSDAKADFLRQMEGCIYEPMLPQDSRGYDTEGKKS